MKMAKLRRKVVKLERALLVSEGLLVAARQTWRDQRAEVKALTATRRAEQLAAVQDRRADLARVAALHHKVLRRVPGRARTERFYCSECNVPFPCRTIECLGRLNDALDETFAKLRAA